MNAFIMYYIPLSIDLAMQCFGHNTIRI